MMAIYIITPGLPESHPIVIKKKQVLDEILKTSELNDQIWLIKKLIKSLQEKSNEKNVIDLKLTEIKNLLND